MQMSEELDTVARVLTPELREFVEVHKAVPGSLIMVLHRVQQEYGFVPRAIAFEVATLLGVPLAKIYGVMTFYHYFKLKQPGRHQVAVCMGTACYLKGGEDLIQEMENLLGVGLNVVTPDGEFSVEAVRCIGCCGLAPVLTVDGEVHGNLKKDDLPDILARYRGK